MRASALMTMLTLPLALSACDGGEEATDTEAMPMAGSMPADNRPMSEDASMMSSGAEMRMASAEGTVTAIDNEAGTITIEHGPVPAVDWPAMTMSFEADAASRQGIAVGDEVTFDFGMSDAGSRITSISKK
ncbi:copper-binding protein [Croceibacterium aestuarii]|uniref:copper-binding protein n=1 Tax=Croceibacterium aestuarii TaxID=3064139 RepID=UPI00272DEC11|nr:copper-binding protein [Croceibacterium sp. D39]